MESEAKRILIIEDDHFISEMYARTLRKGGYVVEESLTGPEGLAKANQGGWDFILLDIMLPDKTGVEIIEEIRASDNKSISDVKIIIITNFEQDDATRQSLEKLADGYLIKAEITPRRMLEIVQGFDSNPPATPAPPQQTTAQQTNATEISPPQPETNNPTESE